MVISIANMVSGIRMAIGALHAQVLGGIVGARTDVELCLSVQ